jgi:hypothetical protein
MPQNNLTDDSETDNPVWYELSDHEERALQAWSERIEAESRKRYPDAYEAAPINKPNKPRRIPAAAALSPEIQAKREQMRAAAIADKELREKERVAKTVIVKQPDPETLQRLKQQRAEEEARSPYRRAAQALNELEQHVTSREQLLHKMAVYLVRSRLDYDKYYRAEILPRYYQLTSLDIGGRESFLNQLVSALIKVRALEEMGMSIPGERAVAEQKWLPKRAVPASQLGVWHGGEETS